MSPVVTSVTAPRPYLIWTGVLGGLKKFSVVAAVCCGLGFCGSTVPNAEAQTFRRINPDRSNITSQISEAMRHLSTDPDRAFGILRSLDRKFPGNERVAYRLGYAHQVTGMSDSAEVYYKKAFDLNPRAMMTGKALGTLYLTEEKHEEAMAVFNRLLDANSHGLSAYKIVGAALRDLGRYDDALQLFERGRERSKRNFVLTLEIANLYKANKDYEKALDEYLKYCEGQKANDRISRGKILEMIRESGDQRDMLVGALEAKLQNSRRNRYVLLDILAITYLESGLLEGALDLAFQADEERISDGSGLLVFADRVIGRSETMPREQRRRHLDLGTRALNAFTKKHPKTEGNDRAKYMLATIYTQYGKGDISGFSTAETRDYLERAVDQYTEISRQYPNSEYAERAALEKGDLLLHVLKQPEKALETYKVGAVNSRHHDDVFTARIAKVYLGQGDFDNAQHYFDGLIRSGVPELVQAGNYYSGLMLAFRGEYEMARDTLTHLAEAEPSSPYTNDAIETAWIVEEGLVGQSGSLSVFLKALQAELIGDTATVLDELNKICSGPVYDVVRPRALFKMGETLYETGDFDGAVSLLKQFLEEYQSSSLRPDVQRTIASIYEFGYEQYQQALREYEVVLMLYPDYAFLDEVRKDVRRLRFIVEGEE